MKKLFLMLSLLSVSSISFATTFGIFATCENCSNNKNIMLDLNGLVLDKNFQALPKVAWYDLFLHISFIPILIVSVFVCWMLAFMLSKEKHPIIHNNYKQKLFMKTHNIYFSTFIILLYSFIVLMLWGHAKIDNYCQQKDIQTFKVFAQTHIQNLPLQNVNLVGYTYIVNHRLFVKVDGNYYELNPGKESQSLNDVTTKKIN
jgi:hypothetical protein